MLRVLDLFSGIGAYSLGLERTGGFKTVAFCENNSYCKKILAQHWADVPCYDDVTTLTGKRLHADGIFPQWIVAGWPCQDISVAGSGSGLDGERSGLWEHVARLAREIGAEGLLLENSSNLLAINGGRDFGRVLADLAALGMHVEWHCLPAAAFDAPHIRDRLWIVATRADAASARPFPGTLGRIHRGEESSGPRHEQPERLCADNVSDTEQSGLERTARRRMPKKGWPSKQPARATFADTNFYPSIGAAVARQERHSWEPEPGVARVAARTPARVDRIAAIGNCNPPIIPEIIGRAILASKQTEAAA